MSWRSDPWPDAAITFPRRAGGRRVAVHYLIDLVVSVCVILLIGWVFEVVVGDRVLRDALVTQNELYTAISRFTPHNLAISYAATVEHMVRGGAVAFTPRDGIATAVSQAGTAVAHLAEITLIAIPRTVLRL